VLRKGTPVLMIRKFGNHIVAQNLDIEIIKGALENFIRAYGEKSLWLSRKNICLEYWGEEKERIESSPVYKFLPKMGFDMGYQGATYWRKSN